MHAGRVDLLDSQLAPCSAVCASYFSNVETSAILQGSCIAATTVLPIYLLPHNLHLFAMLYMLLVCLLPLICCLSSDPILTAEVHGSSRKLTKTPMTASSVLKSSISSEVPSAELSQCRPLIAVPSASASASMLKKLKADESGSVSLAEWNKFMTGIKKARSETVLEGFLSFCEGIVESKMEFSEYGLYRLRLLFLYDGLSLFCLLFD